MKKVISLFLSILMLFSVLQTVPYTALAEDETFPATVDGEITVGSEKVKFLEEFKETAAYSFTAPENEYYEFSVSSAPNYGNFGVTLILTDESSNIIKKETLSTRPIIKSLEKGKTYIIAAYYPTIDSFGNVTVKVTEHEHKLRCSTSVYPTCEQDGYLYYVCSDCDYNRKDILPKGENCHVIQNGKCSKCSTPLDELSPVEMELNTEYSNTLSAGEYVYYAFTSGAAGYYKVSFNSENKKAQARNASSREPYCSESFYFNAEESRRYAFVVFTEEEDSYTISVSPHEHSYDKALKDTKPNCKEAGQLWYRCRECNANVVIDYPVDPETHIFSHGFCTKCKAEDTQWEPTTVDVTLEESVTVTQVQNTRDYICFNFTPEQDGWYYLETDNKAGTGAVYASLYDWDGTKLEGVWGGSASFYKECLAGKTYTVKAYCGINSEPLTCTVTKHVHNFSDTTLTPVTCSQNGRVKHRCIQCQYTYEEDVLSTGKHTYLNGKCKFCGAEDEGYVKPVTEIDLNTQYTFSPKNQYEEVYYTFTPQANGNYCFSTKKIYSDTSVSFYHTYVTVNVTDGEGNAVNPYYTAGSVYTVNENRYYSLEADKTYTFTVIANKPFVDLVSSLVPHVHEYKSNNAVPRCDDYVKEVFTCDCHDSYTVEYEPTGEHVFVETVVAPTCLESGYTQAKCKTCGASYEFDYTAPNPDAHIFKNGICEECGEHENSSDIALITLHSSTSLTLNDEDEEAEARFVPEESGYYCLRSLGKYDTYAELYDSDLNEVGEDDDSGNSYNFRLAAYLEEGKEYRLFVGCYEDFEDLEVSSITFDVLCGKHTHFYGKQVIQPTDKASGYTLHECICGDYYITDITEPNPANACSHSYQTEVVEPTCAEDGFTVHYCTKCNDYYIDSEVPATGKHSYKNNYCKDCGMREPRLQTENTYTLALDDELDVSISSKEKKIFLYFTPEESGTYLFKTLGRYDIYAVLYNSDGETLALDEENGGPAKNAQLVYELSAGSKYRFELQLNSGSDAQFSALITKHTHDFADLIVPADCGNDAEGTHTCKTCFYSYSDVPEKATGNHSFDENGVCTTCGYSRSLEEIIPVEDFSSVTVPANRGAVIYSFTSPHSGTVSVESFSNGSPVAVLLADDMSTMLSDFGTSFELNFFIEAEVKTGVTYYLAVQCLEREYEIRFNFDAVHSYNLINKVAPTCTEKGLSIYKCSECGLIRYDDYVEPSHSFTESISVPPTCTAPGKKLYTCSECGYSYEEALPVLEHDFVEEYVAPNCTFAGHFCMKCRYCGLTKNYTEIPANGVHEFTDHVFAPTYYSEGLTVHFCKICCYEYTDNVVPPLELKLKRRKIKKIKAGKKSLRVWWNADSDAEGYEIQYSASRKFKKRKTVRVKGKNKAYKKLKRLKSGKKYYVRVRSVRTINGKTYRSKWSKKKAVTVK